MPISEICNREVVIMQRHNTILEAVQLMRQHHVGDVVVVEERGGVRVPVGIVTDRDLVVEIMAPAIDQTVITVGDIMVTELATVRENAGLVGILTLDDLLELLAEELLALAKLVRHEQKKETMSRR